MYKIADSLFAFRGMKGSSRTPAEDLLIDFADNGEGSKSISHQIFGQRANFLEQELDTYFLQENIPFNKPVPLANGGESLVMDCQNGYVVKVRKGKSFQDYGADVVLQPRKTAYSHELNVSYEIFDKVETGSASLIDCLKLGKRCLQQGCVFFDIKPDNVGFRIGDNLKREACIIDSGAVGNLNSLNILRAARRICQPVYDAVPFVQPLWREFKGTLKELMGVDKRTRQGAKLNF